MTDKYHHHTVLIQPKPLFKKIIENMIGNYEE